MQTCSHVETLLLNNIKSCQASALFIRRLPQLQSRPKLLSVVKGQVPPPCCCCCCLLVSMRFPRSVIAGISSSYSVHTRAVWSVLLST